MNNKECENKSKFSFKIDDQVVTNEYFQQVIHPYSLEIKGTSNKDRFRKIENRVSAKVPNDIEFKIPCTNQTFIKTFFYQI